MSSFSERQRLKKEQIRQEKIAVLNANGVTHEDDIKLLLPDLDNSIVYWSVKKAGLNFNQKRRLKKNQAKRAKEEEKIAAYKREQNAKISENKKILMDLLNNSKSTVVKMRITHSEAELGKSDNIIPRIEVFLENSISRQNKLELPEIDAMNIIIDNGYKLQNVESNVKDNQYGMSTIFYNAERFHLYKEYIFVRER